MIYVFDTSSLHALQHFYPAVFKSIWAGLNSLVSKGELISTREVWNELEGQNVSAEVKAWAKRNKQTKPNAAKIPNVCQHFSVPCVDLETFMQQQGWSF